jgi:prepilin-type N-terminal cleavage/methylation domain-containing protein
MRARRQDGFTLPELLISLSMSLIILIAALTLVDVTMRKTDDTQNRVTSVQRGRLAMDTITRQLRSQVCLNTATPAMAPPTGWGVNTDGNNALFYVDFSDGSNPNPELHLITYDPANRQLLEKDYANQSKVAGQYAYPAPAAYTRMKVLLDNVVPYTDPATGKTAPIFAYYAYDDTVNPPRPSSQLSGSLTAAQEATVARIDVTFKALPAHASASAKNAGSVFQDEVYVREADPNAVAPTPTCA